MKRREEKDMNGGREEEENLDRTIGLLGGLGEIIARVLSWVPSTWWEASISS